MQDFDKILALTEDSKVELASSFKELLHKELTLGMTRYVCRYGTLSDAHDKITDAQRYYQSIREMYARANEISSQKALSMEAQADLIDAEELLEQADTKSKKLRAEAKILKAKNALRNTLVTIEDSMRQLDEFNRVRLELKDKVQAQYPEGIEQAEPDNWKAVAEYKIARQNIGYHEALHHIPLEIKEKARLGLKYNKPELAYWLSFKEKELLETKYNGDLERLSFEETK